MSSEIETLRRKVAVQEADMNTMRAETKAAFERLRADMAQQDANRAQRDKDLIRTVVLSVGVATAIIGVIVAVATGGIGLMLSVLDNSSPPVVIHTSPAPQAQAPAAATRSAPTQGKEISGK